MLLGLGCHSRSERYKAEFLGFCFDAVRYRTWLARIGIGYTLLVQF